MNTIISQIKSTLELSTIATVAEVATMSGRVFIKVGQTDMTGGVNMGRLPCIYLYQVSTDYEFQAEPNHNGTRTNEFIIRILIPNFMNREETQYLKLESIKQIVLHELTDNLNIAITNVREDAPVTSQMSIHMDIRFNSETSYDKDYDETT